MANIPRKAKIDEVLGQRLSDISAAQLRELLLIMGPIAVVIMAAIWVALQFVEPAPPRRLVISTASEGGGYHSTGKRYAALLAKSGVTLEVRTSKGSIENLQRLKNPASGVHVALLQGGTATGANIEGLVSLGRIYLEPMWLFQKAGTALAGLGDLKGRSVIIGPEGSGTRNLALALLAPYGIDGSNTTLVPLAGREAVDATVSGAVDAAFFTSSAESPLIQSLIRAPGVTLVSLDQSEALTRHFPYLSRVVLPKGAIDLSRNIPSRDVEMVAPMAALVARDDTHPALIGLMVEAAKEVHKPGGMFQRIGEFPKPLDPEIELSDDADRAYKTGPSLLKRLLPFWLAIFIERMSVLVVPVVGLLIPLVKLVPAAYRWRIRRRILYWYGRLKALEATAAQDQTGELTEGYREEIARIDAAVSTIPIPVGFSDDYYSLRSAIDLVRQRLGPAMTGVARQPATSNAG